jgi:hypothetical protein
MVINRRTFSAALVAGAAASLTSARDMAATTPATKSRNVVLVHGLFADGSCWSEVIARLQAAGLNATAVQNPLTCPHRLVSSSVKDVNHQSALSVRSDIDSVTVVSSSRRRVLIAS